MKIKRQTVITTILVLLAIAFMVIGVTLKKEPVSYYAHSLRNYQEADATAGYPIEIGPEQFWTGKFMPQLNMLTGIERYRLPVARSFEKPSLGGKARAVANGLVLMTGRRVVLGHRLPDGRIAQSVYHQIKKSEVRVGQLVARGNHLARTGPRTKFEVYLSDGVDVTLPNHPNRIEIDELITEFPPSNRLPDPLAILLEQEDDFGKTLESLQLDSKSAEKLSEILGGE